MAHRLTSLQIGASTLSPGSRGYSVNSLTSRRTYRPLTIPRPTARPNKSTKSLNNIFASSSTTSRMTGSTCYLFQSSPTTTPNIWLQALLCFLQIRVSTHNSKYLSNQFLPKVLMKWHRILRNYTSTFTNSFNTQSSSTNVTLKTITSPSPISKSATWFGSTHEIFGQDDPRRSLIVDTSGHS